MTAAQKWSLKLSTDETVRQPALSAPPSFDVLTNWIAQELKVLCCHKSQIDETGFKRPVYTLSVGHDLFDLFFNSAHGYRAAYFRSPGIGIDTNLRFLGVIADKLIAAPASANSSLSVESISQSLRTPSAKAWLAEHGNEPDHRCPTCMGEWSASNSGPAELAEIENGRWEFASGLKAEWGRKAPYLTKLRVMGAFLDDRNNEIIPHDKRFRAEEIYKYGWS